MKIVLLSRVTGSVFSGNFSAVDINGSKAREIAGDAQWKRDKLPVTPT